MVDLAPRRPRGGFWFSGAVSSCTVLSGQRDNAIARWFPAFRPATLSHVAGRGAVGRPPRLGC
jgi:hypothetical protein